MTIGIAAVIVLAARRSQRFEDSMSPVGRMALTDHLSQTALGLIVLREFTERAGHTLLALLVVTAAVWLVQLAWSNWWLARFTQGPIEWLCRTATYLRTSPVRLDPAAPNAD